MEDKRIIEINGIKMEVDMRTAKVVENYKVGDNVKVLVKGYDSYKSHIGIIIGFDNFEKTPTVVIAYLEVDYSGANIKFLYYNSETKTAELCPLNEWDMPFTKAEILKEFEREQKKKEEELKELQKKQRVFEQLFGKYFEKDVVKNEVTNS